MPIYHAWLTVAHVREELGGMTHEKQWIQIGCNIDMNSGQVIASSKVAFWDGNGTPCFREI